MSEEQVTYEELLSRIAVGDDAAWQELLRRDYGRLDAELQKIYRRNPIRGAGATFGDVLQEMFAPNPNRPDQYGYLQKALIDVKPASEQDYLGLAKHKFRQRLTDIARRELRHQLVVATDFANEIPEEAPPGAGTIETWQSVREAVAELDDVERLIISLYYGLPQTAEGTDPSEEHQISEIIIELESRGVTRTNEQVKWQLRKARRLLGVLLEPIRQAIEKE